MLLIGAAVLLASCGGETPSGENNGPGADTEEVIEGALRISVTEENGNTKTVGVDEDKDLSSYVVTAPAEASEEVSAAVDTMISTIEKKTGITLSKGEGAKAIVCSLDAELGIGEYALKTNDGKIYVVGGSDESLIKATELFAKFFIYGSNKSLLVPAGKGYTYDIPYYLDALTIDGVDISEFAYFSDAGNYSYAEPVRKIDLFAERANEVFAGELIGIEGLPVAETMEEGGHYIVVSAHSSLVNPYSIKIENGNLYITGSSLSVDAAFDALVSDVIGYTEDTEEQGKTVDLTAANNTDGSMGLTVPYTKDELLKLFKEVYEDDTKIISGTHAWTEQSWQSEINGTGVQSI